MSDPGRPRLQAAPAHSEPLYRANAFALAARLARCTPLPALRLAAGLAGGLYAWTHRERVELVRRNLRLLDPALPRRRARRVYAEFGRTLADYFYIGTRPPERAMRLVSRTEGHEYLEQVRGGAIIVTAHFGLFELGGLLLARLGRRGAVLTLPEPTERLTSWRAAFRRRWNVETLEVGGECFAFLEIAERLRRGEFIATLIDRPGPGGGVPVVLPGGLTRFSSGILLLAAQGGWPVIPALIARQADGTYASHVFPPLEIRELGSREETLRCYSQKIADLFAPVLRAQPEQWYQFVPVTAG